MGFSIDVLVNNAGISIVGLATDLDKDSWENIWNTNVTSVVAMSKACIPDMLRNHAGKIINISSVWGVCGASCETAYSATKGAVNAYTKALAKELAPSNIQVNALACGFIDTEMNDHLSEEEIKEVVAEIPADRVGKPTDVASVVLSLATGNNYVTGQIINVDGGWI
jgi:3-oxoacyl-[acyl-carrier protein] reductase